MSCVKKLKCLLCGKEYTSKEVKYNCPQCGDEGILEVINDYTGIKKDFNPGILEKNKEFSMWRYLPLLSVDDPTKIGPLKVGWTPLYEAKRIREDLGMPNFWIKDDGRNPTASLKDRPSALAVVKAQELGEEIVTCASTGNAALLSCQSIAILPEGMSKERFQWLSQVAGEVIATPGTESNVKEIFDKTWELKKTRDNVVVFNQFEELGNHLWHYEVTGQAMEEVLSQVMNSKDHYAGVVLTTGSAGTLGCGDYLKELYPESKVAAGEALQCPTMLANGFGAHRIEGIGDKHIPWIHNVKNTDLVIAIDDRDVMSLIRLFNEPAGKAYLKEKKIPEETIESLPLMGISSVANLLMAVKFARYYELTARDIILTVFTDSMELYGSRLEELEEEYGPYTKEEAAIDFHRHLQALTTDYLQELTYPDRKRIHNLKYFTWIEQQGKDLEELKAQWYDYENYWGSIHRQTGEIDKLIEEFNRRTGLLR